MPKKAIELGCKPGVHFWTLTEGVEVKLDNGTIVKPSDVMESTPPSESFIVNFIPDESFIESVINNKDYEQYFEENMPENNRIAIVYHSVEELNVIWNPHY